MDPFSLIKKEIEGIFKELLMPMETLEELYSFKEAKNLDTKAHLIAKALGVEEDEELINLIKKALKGKD